MENIYQSITDIMSESISISKDKKNQQQGFMYRGIDDVMNTFYPLFAKHKVFIVPEVLEQVREERVSGKGNNLIYSILKVRYTFYAEDGSSVSAVVIGEGMDSGDKASNKAMAIAMKYAMFQVFCIPTEEMPDPDAETPPQTAKKTVSQPSKEPVKRLPMTLPDAEAMTAKMGDKDVKFKDLTDEQLAKLTEYPREDWKEAAQLILQFRMKKFSDEMPDIDKDLPF